MSVDRGFVNENSKERSRLQALVARSSDADLARPMAAGWTVASVLGHLAFWDQRILALLDIWERTGTVPSQSRSEDTDWINDTGKPFLLALPPRQAADLAVAIAQAVDRKIETLSDELVAKIAAAGNPINLDRAEHRHEHLGEIEVALK
jgi:mycothiol maleylpyruvate isomerase-like protein